MISLMDKDNLEYMNELLKETSRGPYLDLGIIFR